MGTTQADLLVLTKGTPEGPFVLKPNTFQSILTYPPYRATENRLCGFLCGHRFTLTGIRETTFIVC